MDDFLERITVTLPQLKESTSIDCPKCGTQMQLVDIDVYKCPKCKFEVDMFEEE